MKLFISLLRVLVTIGKDIRTIRKILEIAYRKEIELSSYYSPYPPNANPSDYEFVAKEPELDEYEKIDKLLLEQKKEKDPFFNS